MDHASSTRFTKPSDHPWNPSGPTQLQTNTFPRTSASPVVAQTPLPDSASRSGNLSPHLEGPQEDAFDMQRAGGSSEPSNERIKLTKTGRISKAKKGVRVHDCETCGKVSNPHPLPISTTCHETRTHSLQKYTRAEHLR